MRPEFTGIERRLERLRECLQKLEPLSQRELKDFLEDPYLRDIVERNLEVAAQCCLDIANRIITVEGAQKPRDYHGSIIRLGEIGVLSLEFAQDFAPIAGFRNVLIHEYLELDWEEIYDNLRNLDDLYTFMDWVKKWLGRKVTR